MRVVIAGGHGKIALLLERALSGRGDEVAGLVRNPGHAPDLAAAGARAIVCDLETSTVDEVAGHLAGADAVVFAAGAGPGSGIARKDTVDRAAVSRADVAAVLVALLDAPATAGRTLELVGGDRPVADAVAQASRG